MDSMNLIHSATSTNGNYGQMEIVAPTPCQFCGLPVASFRCSGDLELRSCDQSGESGAIGETWCLSSEEHLLVKQLQPNDNDVISNSPLNEFPYRVRSPAPARKNANGRKLKVFHDTGRRTAENQASSRQTKGNQASTDIQTKNLNCSSKHIRLAKPQPSPFLHFSHFLTDSRRSTAPSFASMSSSRPNVPSHRSTDHRPVSRRRENPKTAGIAHWRYEDDNHLLSSPFLGSTSSGSQRRLGKRHEESVIDFSSESSSHSGLRSISDAFPRLAGTLEVCDYLSKASPHADDESLIWLLHSSSVDPSKVSPKDRTLLWVLKQAVDTYGQNTSGLSPGTDPVSGSLCFWRLDDSGEQESQISIRCADFVAWLKQHQRDIENCVSGASKGKTKDPLDTATAMEPSGGRGKEHVEPAERLKQLPEVVELLKRHNMPIERVRNKEIDVILALPPEARAAFLNQVQSSPADLRHVSVTAHRAPPRVRKNSRRARHPGVFTAPGRFHSPFVPPRSPLAQVIFAGQTSTPPTRDSNNPGQHQQLPLPVLAEKNSVRKDRKGTGEKKNKLVGSLVHRWNAVGKWLLAFFLALAITGVVVWFLVIRGTRADRTG